MKVSRRDLLKASALAGASVPLAGCEQLISEATKRMGQAIPEKLLTASDKKIDPLFHLLARAGYGPWPGDLERARKMGAHAWIEEQLEPEKIDDKVCDLRARRFETLFMEPGNCYEFKKPALRADITRHTLLRAVYSKRQLYEAMVAFWTDHLNIYLEKGDCIYLKPSDDRLVIRKHALGKFKEMIRASAVSPAMLVYLDGKENKIGKPADIPNENYARELLELHTLGVHGGYTQHDVYEVARCLTGWRLHTDWQKGTVYFDNALHDNTEKHVFGKLIPANGGEKDLDRVVELACGHPSTAKHIAAKLVRRFIGDDAPKSIVSKVEAVFNRTEGDIKEMMRTILTSKEFGASRGTKFKTPFYFVASALRSVGADTHAHDPLIDYLMRMGQGPFQHMTPDGYPDESAPWMGTLLWRWGFALDLVANRVPETKVDVERLNKALFQDEAQACSRIFQHFIGRAPKKEEMLALSAYADKVPNAATTSKNIAEFFGLILASPAFQRY